MAEDKEDFLIGDVDSYSSKDQQFSHETLIMMALKKAFEYGAKEMKPGYFNESVDATGNVSRTYIEDTRKAFVEAVKTTITVLQCDLDKTAKDKIKEYKESLTETYNKLAESEKKFWDSLPPKQLIARWEMGQCSVKGSLNMGLPFYQTLIEAEVDTYRNIMGELSELTKRKDFYQSEDFVA